MIGDYWTRVKLERIEAYFPFFLAAMHGRYRTWYVDAFASTGRVKLRQPRDSRAGGFFPPTDPFIDGSARRALRLEQPFDRYYFVDIEERKCERLERLRDDFPALHDRIRVRCADANEFVRRFCRRLENQSSRALMFLDAPGTVVGWKTIEEIAQTGAVDLWYLFPLGIAVNRLLKRRGDQISESVKRTLVYLFGSDGWEQEFFVPRGSEGFFPEPAATAKVANFQAITSYFVRRLKTVFPYVAERPLNLYNRRRNPMFSLFFASADHDGKDRLSLAQAILRIPSTAHAFPARLRQLLSQQRPRVGSENDSE